MSKFLNGISLGTKHFFDEYVPLKPKTYCIVIIYVDGYRKEIYGIEEPWKYMTALKKNVRIKSCYIKEEK